MHISAVGLGCAVAILAPCRLCTRDWRCAGRCAVAGRGFGYLALWQRHFSRARYLPASRNAAERRTRRRRPADLSNAWASFRRLRSVYQDTLQPRPGCAHIATAAAPDLEGGAALRDRLDLSRR